MINSKLFTGLITEYFAVKFNFGCVTIIGVVFVSVGSFTADQFHVKICI